MKKVRYALGSLVHFVERPQVVLCSDCYEQPAHSLHVEGHDPATHDVLRTMLYFPGYLRTWVRQIAELYVADVISLSASPQEPHCHKCAIPLEPGMQVAVCVGHLETCRCTTRFLISCGDSADRLSRAFYLQELHHPL